MAAVGGAALQQDQVAALTRRGIAAAALSSATPAADREALLADLCGDRPATKLLFCTPELLSSDRSAALRIFYKPDHMRTSFAVACASRVVLPRRSQLFVWLIVLVHHLSSPELSQVIVLMLAR